MSYSAPWQGSTSTSFHGWVCFHSNIVLKFNTLRFWPLLISAITPWKSLFLDLSKTFTTYFLKKGVHVKPTERSVIGQLHSLTYLHSIAIERILFQYSLLHLKDEPKFRRNLMFNNQPLQKNISICIHCVLLHFLIRCNYLFVWAELISVSLQERQGRFYNGFRERRLRVKQKTTKFGQFKNPTLLRKVV